MHCSPFSPTARRRSTSTFASCSPRALRAPACPHRSRLSSKRLASTLLRPNTRKPPTLRGASALVVVGSLTRQRCAQLRGDQLQCARLLGPRAAASRQGVGVRIDLCSRDQAVALASFGMARALRALCTATAHRQARRDARGVDSHLRDRVRTAGLQRGLIVQGRRCEMRRECAEAHRLSSRAGRREQGAPSAPIIAV